jgi:hypothetical protein
MAGRPVPLLLSRLLFCTACQGKKRNEKQEKYYREAGDLFRFYGCKPLRPGPDECDRDPREPYNGHERGHRDCERISLVYPFSEQNKDRAVSGKQKRKEEVDPVYGDPDSPRGFGKVGMPSVLVGDGEVPEPEPQADTEPGKKEHTEKRSHGLLLFFAFFNGYVPDKPSDPALSTGVGVFVYLPE